MSEQSLQERYERACWEYLAAKKHMQDLARQLTNQYASEETITAQVERAEDNITEEEADNYRRTGDYG